MLKGIPWLICPELLKALSEMEHGNEVVLADTHFSAKQTPYIFQTFFRPKPDFFSYQLMSTDGF